MTILTVEPVGVPAVEPAAFTADSAAAYVGLTVNAMALRRSRGLGPRYLKRGRRVLYLKTDLDTWLTSGTD